MNREHSHAGSVLVTPFWSLNDVDYDQDNLVQDVARKVCEFTDYTYTYPAVSRRN